MLATVAHTAKNYIIKSNCWSKLPIQKIFLSIPFGLQALPASFHSFIPSMMKAVTLICSFLLLCLNVQAIPLPTFFKRFYSPSSATFSVIAHHEGAVFQYNLLKWDGQDLVLNADEQAFFGRVRASEGYILNLPGSNKTAGASQGVANTVNVHVDPNTNKLSTTTQASDSTTGFGIIDQRLSYRNSTEFLACPDQSYRDVYHVYWANNNTTVCPSGLFGYTIDLIVQTDAHITYTPETNSVQNMTNESTTNLGTSSLGLPPILNKKRYYFF